MLNIHQVFEDFADALNGAKGGLSSRENDVRVGTPHTPARGESSYAGSS
jgi:hypothetical protein